MWEEHVQVYMMVLIKFNCRLSFIHILLSAASCRDVISSPGLIQNVRGQFLQNVAMNLRISLLLFCRGRQDEETAWAPQVNSAGGSGLKPEKRQTVGFSDAALEVFDTNVTRQTIAPRSHLTNEGRARKEKVYWGCPRSVCCAAATEQNSLCQRIG